MTDELDYAELEERLRNNMEIPPNFIMSSGNKDFLMPEVVEGRRYWPAIQNVPTTTEDAKKLIDAYRTEYPEITKIWQEFERLEREGKAQIIDDSVVLNKETLIFVKSSDEIKEDIRACLKFLEQETPRFNKVFLRLPKRLKEPEIVPKQKTYGPPKIGKRGKIKRW